MPNIYIHTINGRPAVYDGDQICYATHFGKNTPATSLRQIRREQKASREWQEAEGLEIYHHYGYARYWVEA